MPLHVYASPPPVASPVSSSNGLQVSYRESCSGAERAIVLSAQTASLEHHYIDAFAGAGVHSARRTGEYIPGSPLNALNVRPPFKHPHLIDLDGDSVENLRKIAADRQDVTVDEGAKIAEDIFTAYRKRGMR
jgi:three-Cys-motif partner protein